VREVERRTLNVSLPASPACDLADFPFRRLVGDYRKESFPFFVFFFFYSYLNLQLLRLLRFPTVAIPSSAVIIPAPLPMPIPRPAPSRLAGEIVGGRGRGGGHSPADIRIELPRASRSGTVKHV